MLIDGAYGGQTQGTGITTYARTLAAGLVELGHQIAWLLGADAPVRGDSLIDAVDSFDAPAPVRGIREKAQTAGRMLGGLATSGITARRINQETVIAPPNAPKLADAYLAPNLYVHAHYRHMLLRQFTEVRLPDPADVLHLTAPLPIRMRGVRTVTTIHDLVPIRLPYTTPDNKSEFVARVRTCARLSDRIITVSEASKKDIVDLLGVDPARISVTYQPVDVRPIDPSEADSIPRTLSRYGLEPGGFVLFVGAIEPKKNLRRLIEAFVEVDSPTPLAIVGRKAWMWEQEIGDLDAVFGEKARKRLRFLGHAKQEDLRRLYAGAMMLVFPSLYEGFGLPPLEAMTMGCPVITSNIASLPEVCGDAALYVDPADRDSIRIAIDRLMSDSALRNSLAQAGRAQAQRFSFQKYLERLKAAYAELET